MTTAAHPRRAWVEQIMGLPISVHLRGAAVPAIAGGTVGADRAGPARAGSGLGGAGLAGADVERAVAAVFADLRRADAVFSPYRDDSDLARWERGELTLDGADATLAAVVALCDEARERTDGWFDPRGLPDPRTGRPRYDPSGLVKGWAVRGAAEHLAALDGYGWCLNAGGDVVAYAPADQPAWRVGIEEPDSAGRLLGVVTRRGGAVATSGTAHRGAHIVDPYTRKPATAVRAVTVVGPDLLWADVYATAAVARGPRAVEWLDGLDGYEALLLTASGLLRATAGWPPT